MNNYNFREFTTGVFTHDFDLNLILMLMNSDQSKWHCMPVVSNFHKTHPNHLHIKAFCTTSLLSCSLSLVCVHARAVRSWSKATCSISKPIETQQTVLLNYMLSTCDLKLHVIMFRSPNLLVVHIGIYVYTGFIFVIYLFYSY